MFKHYVCIQQKGLHLCPVDFMRYPFPDICLNCQIFRFGIFQNKCDFLCMKLCIDQYKFGAYSGSCIGKNNVFYTVQHQHANTFSFFNVQNVFQICRKEVCPPKQLSVCKMLSAV